MYSCDVITYNSDGSSVTAYFPTEEQGYRYMNDHPNTEDTWSTLVSHVPYTVGNSLFNYMLEQKSKLMDL